MGGSGGGFFSGSSDPEELVRRTRDAEDRAGAAAFDTEVSAFLADELATYNDRDTEAVQEAFDAIQSDIASEIEGTVDLRFGGSVAKHTYVDGLSDIDALVLFDRTDYSHRSPSDLKSLLEQLLAARYGRGNVSVGALAVTVNIGGTTMQLLPALRDGGKFKIASADGGSWARVDPQGFASALTRANRRLDGKLVPCVKLAKAIIGELPERRRVTGYHAESLAIEVFRAYDGPRTPKAMLRHFFEQAREHVMEPIRDRSGQSVHVDEYLGVARSLERRIVADALGRIGRKIRNADGARSIESWKGLFGGDE